MLKSHKSRGSQRQELDVQLPLVLAIAAIVTVLIYGFLYTQRSSYLGILLYERGMTQYLVVFLAATVAVFTVLKFIRLQGEFRALNHNLIPSHVSLGDRGNSDINHLMRSLSYSRALVATRCNRILAAYQHSGSRKAASELALDDSAFYASVSESSYTVPRILVWAIPLLGFIGTVIGISRAVNGFSGFLQQAGDIEQIREGIGTVTGGLAVAFDTTLLALLLSVLVMIPLVFAERSESRLLLAIDTYINDRLLVKLREAPTSANLDERGIKQAVNEVLQAHLPEPEAFLKPAQIYAEQAANALAESFVAQMSQVTQMSERLIEQMGQLNQLALGDRQQFIESFERQQQASSDIVKEIRLTVDEIKQGNSVVAAGLTKQTEKLSHQLERAALALSKRVAALEQYAAQVSEIAQLQQTLEQNLRSLEQTAHLEEVLSEVRDNLTQLRPALEKLNKPRRITFVENED